MKAITSIIAVILILILCAGIRKASAQTIKPVRPAYVFKQRPLRPDTLTRESLYHYYVVNRKVRVTCAGKLYILDRSDVNYVKSQLLKQSWMLDALDQATEIRNNSTAELIVAILKARKA